MIRSMQKIGFTCSCFDLLHAGHVLMLEESKQHCDYLVVGLQTDPTIDRPEKNKPIQSITERYLQLKAVKWVDEIIPYTTENDLLELLKIVDPNIRFVGEEYLHKVFTGQAWCLENDVDIFYNKRMHSYSSSSLRERIRK